MTISFHWHLNSSITKCLWLFLAIAFLPVSAWSSGPPVGLAEAVGKPKADYAQHGENPKATEMRGTKDFPIGEENKGRAEFFSPEWWMVYVTGLLSLITLGLAIYTAKLYRATVALGNDAKLTSERQAGETSQSLAIANAAAQAAISGNELSRKAFISSQRPWVVVKTIYPNSAFDLTSGLSFTFVIKNVGNSPGMNVDVGALMHLPHRGDAHEVHRRLREDQASERRKRATFEDISFGHLLAPGEEIEITVRTQNDPAEYQKAAAMHPFGEVIILIIGQVGYRFGIGESWHESGFMFSVRRHGDKSITLADGVVSDDEVKIQRFAAGFYAT